jgi:cardiolipin synthase
MKPLAIAIDGLFVAVAAAMFCLVSYMFLRGEAIFPLGFTYAVALLIGTLMYSSLFWLLDVRFPGTRAVQTLLASAKESIHITTPYFLPDASVFEEMEKAIKRGVEIKVLTPGDHNDHMLTRSSSRRAYGRLLKAGARIFEYNPGMLHAKVLVVDGEWAVVGSTNFDNRSFGLNDEVNMAVCEKKFAGQLESDFRNDLAESTEFSYERWQNRSLFERAPEVVGWILERQQ